MSVGFRLRSFHRLVAVAAAASVIAVTAGVTTSPASANATAPSEDPSRATGVTQMLPNVDPETPAVDGELVSLRTADSRTYVGPDGTRVVHVYADPVNAQDSTGAWKPIDPSLQETAGGWSTRNAVIDVHLPTNLGTDPITLTSKGQDLTFHPTGGASSVGTLSGSTVTYAEMAAGTEVRYTSTADGLKETVVFDSADHAAPFSSTLTMPQGAALTQEDDGSIQISDTDGVLFTLPAPSAVDSSTGPSGPAQTPGAFTVSGEGRTRTITASVPHAWLNDPARVWPVLLDPTSSTTSAYDTYIENGTQATTNFSGATGGKVCAGYDSTNSSAARTILNYLNDGFPTNAKVVSAGLNLHVLSTTGSQALQLYPETTAFTDTQATWNVHDTGSSWTTPGSDLGTLESSQTITAADGSGVFHEWVVDPQVIEAWLKKPSTFLGWTLKAATETSGNLVCMQGSPGSTNKPYLLIQYAPVLGTPSSATTFDHTLDSHESFHVNVSNGNLVVGSGEFHASTPGVPLSISRTYNSLTASTNTWMLGDGWDLTPGDTSADPLNDDPNFTGSHSYTATYGSDGHLLYAHPNSYSNLAVGTYPDPLGENATVTKDASSNLTITDHASQLAWKYLNSNNLMLDRITDRDANAETVAYSTDVCSCYGNHFVSTVTDTGGRVYTYAHNAGNTNITGITGPTINSAALTTAYTQSSGNLTDARDTLGKHTLYGYDSSHRMTSITTPTGRKVLFSYDAQNRVSSLMLVINYNTGCVVSTPTSCTGDSYTFTYTDPTTFGANGTTVVTDPNSHTTTYTWGAQTEVSKTLDGLSRGRSTTYSPNGDVATLTDNASTPNVSTLTYDTNTSNLLSVQAPAYASGTGHDGAKSQLFYPTVSGSAPYPAADYLATSSQDAQGHTTTYSYNTAGHLSTVTPPSGIGGSALADHYQGETGYSCGGKPGELCASTDGLSHSTTYAYNTAGLPTTITPPSALGAKTYTYDALGEVATATDGKSQKTTYTYDNGGHILELQFGGITTCTTTPVTGDIATGKCIVYTYDDDGNLATRQSTVGTVTYTYDPTGLLASKTVPGSTTSSVTYDAAGNVATYADAGGTVTYYYDAANDLTGVAQPTGTCSGTIFRCIQISYTVNAQRSVMTEPSGETITYGYDNAGRETSITAKRPSGTAFFTRSINYQTAAPADTDLVQSVTDNPGTTTTDTYDGYNRLTSAALASGTTYGYSYDVAGNRLTATKTAVSTQHYGYNNADELCESGTSTVTAIYTSSCTGTPGAGNTQYTYDLDGNQTTGVYANTYNTGNQTTATGALSFTYADAGQTERSSSTASSTTTTLLNGAEGVSGATIGASTPIYFTRDPQGNPLSLRIGAGAGTNTYYLTDQQGSTIALTDSSGNTDTANYTYDPYGQTLTATGSGATQNPYRYATGYYDSSGLLKIGARYYNPNLGQWTQHDTLSFSITDATQVNGFAYTGGDPASANDPTGHSLLGTLFDEKDAVNALDDFVNSPDDLYGDLAGAVAGVATDTVCNFGLGVLDVPTVGAATVAGESACTLGAAAAGNAAEEEVNGD